MTGPLLSGETKFLLSFAAVIWVIFIAASISMGLGNPTAVNAMIGCGIPGLLVTAMALMGYRDDRRRRRGLSKGSES